MLDLIASALIMGVGLKAIVGGDTGRKKGKKNSTIRMLWGGRTITTKKCFNKIILVSTL